MWTTVKMTSHDTIFTVCSRKFNISMWSNIYVFHLEDFLFFGKSFIPVFVLVTELNILVRRY